MTELEETKKCPYCSEEILVTAKKCKHCGEWLDNSQQRKGSDWSEKGSFDARSVTKGLKQKEQDDFILGCFGVIGLILSIGIGTFISKTFSSTEAGWITGIVIFIIAVAFIGKWYNKE